MSWSSGDCTRATISFETLAGQNFLTLSSASQRGNRFVVSGTCDTEGVPGGRGHRNLKSMYCVNSWSNRRRARGLYPPQHHTSLLDKREKLPARKAAGRKRKRRSSSTQNKTTFRNLAQSDETLPCGIICSSENILALSTAIKNEKDACLYVMDCAIVSLKTQVQKGKQTISYLKQQVCEGIDVYQTAEVQEDMEK
ncbi:hypothetical protein TNIN_206391 [Trichonephila inaurata madagascariensis]|uniref:REST corepressor helical domain-containing protein n=1 Tax=Trichonephila inaurata madagascariensis TaxID=2747483 RepID=A0A8X7BWA4_9ARAC|nr:hypothetical protein TNIN_206391 [Trichonephila inaurata madagascariensis]